MDINKAYQLIIQKLTVWLHTFIQLLPKIKLLAAQLIKKTSRNRTPDNLFTSVVYIFFIGIVLFIVLSVLHLSTAVTSVLAGAGIFGLAIAFAFQDIAANFISGIFLSFRRPLHIADIVKIKDYMGRVEEINLRDTVIRTFQGQIVIIPNKDVFQNPIENYTLLGKRRIDLKIGISYGDDLEKVKDITLAAVKNIEGLSKEEEVTMYYTDFGDSSVNFLIRLWSSSPDQPDYLRIGSEAIICIKKAYNENNIMIPFPIRTLDFGIKGGTPLNEMDLKVAGT